MALRHNMDHRCHLIVTSCNWRLPSMMPSKNVPVSRIYHFTFAHRFPFKLIFKSHDCFKPARHCASKQLVQKKQSFSLVLAPLPINRSDSHRLIGRDRPEHLFMHVDGAQTTAAFWGRRGLSAYARPAHVHVSLIMVADCVLIFLSSFM